MEANVSVADIFVMIAWTKRQKLKIVLWNGSKFICCQHFRNDSMSQKLKIVLWNGSECICCRHFRNDSMSQKLKIVLWNGSKFICCQHSHSDSMDKKSKVKNCVMEWQQMYLLLIFSQ